jgi:hypothetical protein
MATRIHVVSEWYPKFLERLWLMRRSRSKPRLAPTVIPYYVGLSVPLSGGE